MKIYYAHHLWKYGTEIEKYEIELIKSKFPGCEIINPNGDIDHKDIEDESKIMEECLAKVVECESLVFSSISGVVGRGVWEEVNHADGNGKNTFYITDNDIINSNDLMFQIINQNRRVFAIVVKE
jgi:hypothetical protein